MKSIRIDVGVYTKLNIDFTNFDWTGISKVIFLIKNYKEPDIDAVVVREFTQIDGDIQIDITPEESMQLKEQAEYGFMIVLEDGKTYKNCEDGKVELRKGVIVCGK